MLFFLVFFWVMGGGGGWRGGGVGRVWVVYMDMHIHMFITLFKGNMHNMHAHE